MLLVDIDNEKAIKLYEKQGFGKSKRKEYTSPFIY
jgi:ribosomal protein S18 acetylase RimI-like enzyme